jgi:hypothetical protein
MDEQYRATVERIVAEGERTQEQIRDAVEEAAGRAAETSKSMRDVARETIEAAVSAINRSMPEDPDSVLRSVIDGVGEGLERTAQATKLAVEEASAEGRHYAENDLKSVAEDLKELGAMFADTVERGVKGAGEQTIVHLKSAREHAERTASAIRPVLENAAEAALRDPIKLAGESAAAAAHLSREATGALFNTVGNLLKGAGDRISGGGGKKE